MPNNTCFPFLIFEPSTFIEITGRKNRRNEECFWVKRVFIASLSLCVELVQGHHPEDHCLSIMFVHKSTGHIRGLQSCRTLAISKVLGLQSVLWPRLVPLMWLSSGWMTWSNPDSQQLLSSSFLICSGTVICE